MRRLHAMLLGLMLLAPVARGQDGRAWVEPGDEAVVVQSTQGVTGGIAMPVSVLGTVAPSAPTTVVGKDADGVAPTGNSIPIAGKDPSGDIRTISIGSGNSIALGAAGDAATIPSGSMVRPTSDTGGNGGLLVGLYGFNAGSWRRTLSDAAGNLFSLITDGTDTALISGSGALFVSDVGGLQLSLQSTNASILANVGALNTNSRTVGTGFFMEGNRAEGAAIENPVVIAGKDSGGNRDAIETDDNGAMKTSSDQGAISRTGAISDGTGTLLIPQYAIIEQSTTDPVTIKTAVAATTLVVTNVAVIGDGNTDVTFRSNATAITGDIPLTKNSGLAPGFDPTGHFRALSNEALVVQTSSATHIAGWIKWVEVPD